MTKLYQLFFLYLQVKDVAACCTDDLSQVTCHHANATVRVSLSNISPSLLPTPICTIYVFLCKDVKYLLLNFFSIYKQKTKILINGSTLLIKMLEKHTPISILKSTEPRQVKKKKCLTFHSLTSCLVSQDIRRADDGVTWRTQLSLTLAQ